MNEERLKFLEQCCNPHYLPDMHDLIGEVRRLQAEVERLTKALAEEYKYPGCRSCEAHDKAHFEMFRKMKDAELQLGIAKKHLLGLMCDCGKGVEVPPEGHAADCNGVHWADLTKE